MNEAEELKELKDHVSMLYGMVRAQEHLIIALATHSNNFESVLKLFEKLHDENSINAHFELFTDKELEHQQVFYGFLSDSLKRTIQRLY